MTEGATETGNLETPSPVLAGSSCETREERRIGSAEKIPTNRETNLPNDKASPQIFVHACVYGEPVFVTARLFSVDPGATEARRLLKCDRAKLQRATAARKMAQRCQTRRSRPDHTHAQLGHVSLEPSTGLSVDLHNHTENRNRKPLDPLSPMMQMRHLIRGKENAKVSPQHSGKCELRVDLE